MDINHHLQPQRLQRYCFLWSQARQVLAAVALFVGGIPTVVYFFPSSSFLASLLTPTWLISGFASAFLLYRWNEGGRKLFGGTDQKDMIAFLISGVTGINLGLAGLLGTNFGMTIASGRTIFFVTGVVYVWTVWHLQKRWNESGQRLF